MTEQITYGGKVVGKALKEDGVECLFGVHGAPNLILEEACSLGAKMYHFRHEQSAGFSADAYARCLRRPGVCFASNAPGFANIVSPMYHAKGCLSPVVLLVGGHGSKSDGTRTYQEGYAADLFKPMCKWTHRCTELDMLSFWVRKALKDCMHYPPGPITLEFPANLLNTRGPNRQQKYIDKDLVPKIPKSAGDPVYVEKVVRSLMEAKSPLLIAGDGVYWSDGMDELNEFAELLQIPTSTRRTARGALAENHPLAFTPAYRIGFAEQADVICLLGIQVSFLDEWFEPPSWSQTAKYIQIQETPEEIWYGLPTDITVVGTSKVVLRQMIDCAKTMMKKAPDRSAWLEKLNKAREKREKRRMETVQRHTDIRPIHPHVLCAKIAEFLDPSATVIYDSFTASAYLTDKLEARFAGQILDAGLHQALGHSIGMAVGAQVARPGKQVLAVIGDGGFGIGGMDMETLLRYELPSVIVLLNNDSWGGRCVGQKQYYPKIDSWDNLPDLRYDRMLADLGCHGEYVKEPEEIIPALDRAFNSGVPSLINVRSEATELHPLRVRVNIRDIWTRGNVEELTEEARAELRKLPPLAIKRAFKHMRDYGLDPTIEELAEIAGIPMEDMKD